MHEMKLTWYLSLPGVFDVKTDEDFIRIALRLAQRGYGATSPNPMVGAVLVDSGKIIGRGWHRRAAPTGHGRRIHEIE